MNSSQNVLKRLGIPEKQAEVYLACLQLGSATIQELSQASGVKRSSIYNFLEEMKSFGLVSEVRRGKKVILIAEDPRFLKNKLTETGLALEESLPELLSVYSRPGNKPRFRYYEGLAGVKKAYDDTYSHGGPLYGFGDYEKVIPALVNDYIWKFADERTKRGIKFYTIAKDGPVGRQVRRRDKTQLRETRLVKNLGFETEINMYAGNRVAMMSLHEPISAVIIEDKAICQTLLSIWKIMWQGLEKK